MVTLKEYEINKNLREKFKILSNFKYFKLYKNDKLINNNIYVINTDSYNFEKQIDRLIILQQIKSESNLNIIKYNVINPNGDIILTTNIYNYPYLYYNLILVNNHIYDINGNIIGEYIGDFLNTSDYISFIENNNIIVINKKTCEINKF